MLIKRVWPIEKPTSKKFGAHMCCNVSALWAFGYEPRLSKIVGVINMTDSHLISLRGLRRRHYSISGKERFQSVWSGCRSGGEGQRVLQDRAANYQEGLIKCL